MRDRTGVDLMRDNDHVPEIKRRIWVAKERSRDVLHSLTFNRIPKWMTIHTIIIISKVLNCFLTKVGVSTKIIPRYILNGGNLDYENHLQLQYGKYCQVHDKDTPTTTRKLGHMVLFY